MSVKKKTKKKQKKTSLYTCCATQFVTLSTKNELKWYMKNNIKFNLKLFDKNAWYEMKKCLKKNAEGLQRKYLY